MSDLHEQISPFRKCAEADYLELLEASDIPLEFVDGFVYPRADSSLRHCQINTNILAVLLNATQDTQHWVYSNQMRLRLAPPHFQQVMNFFPDIFISSEESEPYSMSLSAPSVIIEITSAETYRTDTSWKSSHYRLIPSLQAYLLVDSESRAVAVYHRLASGFEWGYEVITERVDLPSLGVSLSLDDVYRGVTL